MLVLGGAGTGKTKVFKHRIEDLIKSGIPGESILALVFTEKAASEMKEVWRKRHRFGSSFRSNAKASGDSAPTIFTFQSLCTEILRRRIELLSYPAKFEIYDRGDQEEVARSTLRELNIGNKLLAPDRLLYWIGYWKRKSLSPDQATFSSVSDAQHLAAIGYQRYQRRLKLYGAVDFDDLLLLTQKIFNEFEHVRLEEASRYDHVLVDEFEEISTNQYRILIALAVGHRNLCVMGDEDQAIYGWNGGEVEHLVSFNKDWPDTKVVRLLQSYRSTQEIIDAANTLIKFNFNRHDKALRPAQPGCQPPRIEQYENDWLEAQETVRDIQRRLVENLREPRDFAILFRTNEQARVFEAELRKAKLPYVSNVAKSFFDRKEVKDVLAYLRLLNENPDMTSILRVINTPPRGIGKKSVEALMDFSIKNKVPLWNLVTDSELRPELSDAANCGLDELASKVEEVRNQMRVSSLVDLARSMISTMHYRSELERIYSERDDRESRWAVVEHIFNLIANYEDSVANPRLGDFADKLLHGEIAAEDEKQLNKNAIKLMTIHSAKGLEFPEVYLVGLEEGLLPHYHSLDSESTVADERRLCYVGLTRAMERVTLSMAMSRMKRGRARSTIPSRFLYELTEKTDHPNYKRRR